VERVIGVGGMGVVVEAVHIDLDRRVALKFMLVDAIGHTGEAVARFLREGRAAAKLQSEHVARVLDVGRLDTGEPYMVMEFLEGKDLSDVLQAEGPQPIDRAVSYVLQACEAIAEAHAAGIVHRDLKPSNLFLSRRSDGAPLVKVLDFGISKVVRSENDAGVSVGMTSTQAMLGSPAYMSPEQVRSTKNVDGRTDIWALGIVLYELLACQSPFVAESVPALIAAIASDPAIPIVQRRPDVPPLLADVVMRCLEKDPSRRFASVAELAIALQRFGSPDDDLLVSRIVRVQKTAGLTQLDTKRPPAFSVPDPSHPGEVSATAATFGVTAGEPKSRRWVALGAGVFVLALFSGGTAWWVARSTATSGSQDMGLEAGLGAATVPNPTALLTAPAQPTASEGAHDAGAEAVPTGVTTPAGATSTTVPTKVAPRATSAAPKVGSSSSTGRKDAPRSTSTSDPVVDLSERR
jgi:serine/threonine protein kinase